MWKCNMGYPVGNDNIPPDRCHWEGKYDIKSCKECSSYNHEYDLIEQAIESARCRTYRLKQSEGSTLAHQKKAEHQRELMKVTIKALEFYRTFIGIEGRFYEQGRIIETKNIKQKELEEIEKQLDEIYEKEFIESENYVGKFYNLDNSNIYFHVTDYNPNKGELFGTEIVFNPESLDTYHEECKTIDESKYTEISEEKMRGIIKEQIDYLVEEFMR